jgi:hypothetical protein
MNALDNVERRDSGTASQDRASEHFGDTEAEHREQELRAGFAMSAGYADANAVCDWAPVVTDYDLRRKLHLTHDAKFQPKRYQTMTEVMYEALDYSTGPSLTEAMQLILNACRSTDADLAQQAANLVDRMGAAFARMNS